MNNQLKYGVILAAGNGSRMYPLTHYYPKLLLPVLEKPLLFHHFDIMKSLGIEKVFIVVSPNNEKEIDRMLKVHEEEIPEYEFVIQHFLGGSGHAVLLLKEKIKNSLFFLLLGDEYYFDIGPFKDIKEAPRSALGIVEYDEISKIQSGCNVHINDGEISALVEKPKVQQIKGKWCWDGSAVLPPAIFDILNQMNQRLSTVQKDSICLVEALKLLLSEQTIEYVQKEIININLTSIKDFVIVNLVELLKTNDAKSEVCSLLNNFRTKDEDDKENIKKIKECN